MAKTKRNQRIHIDTVDNTIASLQNLSAKPQLELTLRESISLMEVHLRSAIKKGYSYQDLSEILAEQEILVSAATLKLYLSEGSKNKKSSTRKRKSKSATNSTSISKPSSKSNSNELVASKLSTNITDSKKELGTSNSNSEINSMLEENDLKQAVKSNSTIQTKSSSSAGNKAKAVSRSNSNKSNASQAKILSGSNDDLSSQFNNF